MDAISLLPPEIREQRQAQQRAALRLWGGAAVLLVLLCIYAVLWGQTFRERRTVDGLKVQQAGLNAEIQKYQEDAALQQSIDQLGRIADQAKGVTPDWASLLTSIGVALPDGVWLTDVVSASPAAQGGQGNQAANAAAAPGNKTVSIQGWAFSHRQVADYLSRLQQAPGLNSVSCRFTGEEEYGSQQMIHFEIWAALQDNYPGRLPGQGGIAP